MQIRTRVTLLLLGLTMLPHTANADDMGGGVVLFLARTVVLSCGLGFGLSIFSAAKRLPSAPSYFVTLALGVFIDALIGTLVAEHWSWRTPVFVLIGSAYIVPVPLTIAFALGYAVSKERRDEGSSKNGECLVTYPPTHTLARKAETDDDLSAVDRALLGTCPNCRNVIRLNSEECPRCKATFGEGSAWKITPLTA